MRIALIHALAHSVAPIQASFDALWPQAQCINLLDDSLSADLAAQSRGLEGVMTQRFLDLSAYALNTGCDAILFTCSAFGPCIDAVKTRWPHVPVLKPNEAMVEEVATYTRAHTCSVGLLASFAPTLQSMPVEFPADIVLQPQLCAAAMQALHQGDMAAHDAAVLQAAQVLQDKGVGALALAQFSMARAAPLLQAHLGLPIFTTPDSAVRRLKSLLL